MNLASQSWIPVTDAEGHAKRVSLNEVFTHGHLMRDLAVRPHERVALMRLFLAVAHAALKGPADSNALDQAAADLPQAAATYLEQWQDCFDLFHATKPFLQLAGLSKPPKAAGKKAKQTTAEEDVDEGCTAASKLDFAMATGNNSTLFDNAAASDGVRLFDPGQMALMLLTFQCFSPGGRIGVAQWKGEETPGGGSSGHAPCSPSAMLHSFVRGETLLGTIVGNIVTARIVQQLYGHPLGRPVWELPPSSFGDMTAVENATKSYLGRMTPLSRAILLKPDGSGLVLGNGWDYPTPPEFEPEPSATLVRKKDDSGHVLLGAGSAKALWRELPAMTVERRMGQTGGPVVLAGLEGGRELDLWIGALVTDKASILDAVESVYRIPARLFGDPGRELYKREIEQSEKTAMQLGDACKTYRQLLELKPQGYPEKETAFRRYWNEVDQHSSLLLDHLREEEGSEAAEAKLKAWRSALWRAAYSALQAACPAGTPRQQRAYALARRSMSKSEKDRTEQKSPMNPEAV